jgi:subtilisin family serine protease
VRNSAAIAVLAFLALTAASASAAAADDPLRSSQWYLDDIHADAAQKVATGRGVTVAVVDSGVDDSHPDLAGAVVNGPDFVDNDSDPNDEQGHGTAIAGIIAAQANNGIGVRGAAPGVKILAIRVLDKNNSGTTDNEAKGIDAAVRMGAQVINLSITAAPNALASILPSSLLVGSIEKAVSAGVVVVAAAGNYALPLCSQPTLISRILCVGGVNRQLTRSSYSNYGLRVDIVAPGGETTSQEDAIVSTGRGGSYTASAGTSEAAPQVAAAAALLRSQGLPAAEVIDRLTGTATDIGPAGMDLTYGYGLLNMSAAVGLPPVTAAGPGSAASPATSATSKAKGAAVTTPTGVRRAALLSKGIRVQCRMQRAGTCRVRLTLGKTLLGQAARNLRAGASGTLVVRLTAKGRRTVRKAKPGTLQIRVQLSTDRLTFIRRMTLRR